MSFITFIYKIENIKKTFYGKFVFDYMSDDHEGLDTEVRPIVIDGINEYRKQNNQELINEEQIYIGILSLSSDFYIPVYSSKEEILCFDFYYETFNHICKTYINGCLVK